MKAIICLLLLAPSLVFACGNDSPDILGVFYGAEKAGPIYGDSVSVQKNGDLNINMGFLASLASNPTGEEFSKNRYELLYLISRGNYEALRVGMKTLSHLVKNPTTVVECDHRVDPYNTKELAHSVSRSHLFNGALCELSESERKTVIAYYKANQHLYQQVYDAPWSYSVCNN